MYKYSYKYQAHFFFSMQRQNSFLCEWIVCSIIASRFHMHVVKAWIFRNFCRSYSRESLLFLNIRGNHTGVCAKLAVSDTSHNHANSYRR